MGLSIDFAMPGPEFDPTRYGRKSAACSGYATKTSLMPEAGAVTSMSPPQKSDKSETAIGTLTSPNKEVAIETTNFDTESESSAETQQTTSPTRIDIIPEAEFEQNDSFQALKKACTEQEDEGYNHITSPEVKVDGQAYIPGLNAEPIRPGTGNSRPCLLTTLTAEKFGLPSNPALDDAEPTDTRRLVSIRRIRHIRQAKVVNRWLTLAQVDEWTCTIPRRAFGEGELVVYVEIDAFLPSADSRFGVMSSLQTYNGRLGHRVKTKRFGSYPEKLVVQGCIYPLDKFEEIFQELKCIQQVLDNDSSNKSSQNKIKEVICAMYRREDWAAKIGVEKWEEPKPTNKPNKYPKLGAVPTRVFKKTDITHFEDCPNLFIKNKYFAHEYQETIKMDGASMTVYFVNKTSSSYHDLNGLPEQVGPNMIFDNGRFGVASKSVDLHELSTCAFGYWKTALKNDLAVKLSNLGRSIAIQGEICGPGINKNREKLDETEFFVYSMWDIPTQKYIDPRKVQALADKLGLKHVPVLGYVKIRDIASSHNDLRKLADKRPGEGLVYKCVRDGRSFKVHSPAYKVLHNC